MLPPRTHRDYPLSAADCPGVRRLRDLQRRNLILERISQAHGVAALVVIDPVACDPRRQVLVDLGLGLRCEVAQRVSKDDPDSAMGNPCSMALIGLVMMWSFQFVDLAFFCART